MASHPGNHTADQQVRKQCPRDIADTLFADACNLALYG